VLSQNGLDLPGENATTTGPRGCPTTANRAYNSTLRASNGQGDPARGPPKRIGICDLIAQQTSHKLRHERPAHCATNGRHFRKYPEPHAMRRRHINCCSSDGCSWVTTPGSINYEPTAVNRWSAENMANTTDLSDAIGPRSAESLNLPGDIECLAGARAAGTKPYRMGRVNITGYFAPSVKQSIRLIQAKYPNRTVQDLLAEALNDLFGKYDVPQTADSDK
jgi:hypothetical protein